MDRRDLIRTLGAAAVTAAAIPTFAQLEHHHEPGTKHLAFINAASACANNAELCVTHCEELLGQGDKSLAACVAHAREVSVLCGALRSLAAQNAPSLPRLAKIAADACKGCEVECRKHEKHQACKDCADACGACSTECMKAANA
jgi:Cys-rich four helix bundle protein (predicted Tat secretion target)